ncbi:ABC-three component system protein [Chitinophaga sp.]|uniref:ABC-three component system protein n=1 Tax=Chitinophaga sp. TaxID=1869181 RepID=UPI0031D4243E
MIKLLENGKKRKNNLILFIHGLTGDESTWTNEKGMTFPELLFTNSIVKKNYDIGLFNYYSKIFNPVPVKLLGKLFNKFINIKSDQVELNLDVESISDILVTELEVHCNDYKKIVVIAHSLGGLIAKCTALRLVEKESTINISKLISLAVPHIGSSIATIVKLVARHAQINDLAPLSDITTKLSNNWIQDKTEKLPQIIYFYGKYDRVVQQNSALGVSNEKQIAKFFEADHENIAKPASNQSSIYKAAEQILLEVISEAEVDNALTVRSLPDSDTFNDEFFVLKLLVADVHEKSIHTAKTSFYNAEFIRKVGLQRKVISQSNFDDLMGRIEILYNNAYALLTVGKLKDGNELVAHIHDQIRQEDNGVLKTLERISFIHKTGMLHQLSNNSSKDIWWGKDHNNDTIEAFKKGQA